MALKNSLLLGNSLPLEEGSKTLFSLDPSGVLFCLGPSIERGKKRENEV
jgi:hypothetical protein